MDTRYSRQIILPEIGERGQKKLTQSHIAIVGCGGLGAIAAAYLAGAGIGKITLIDGDVPDISNVHRQVFYNGQETESKSNVLKQRLLDINPDIEVESIPQYISKENIDAILTGIDLVLECSDDIFCKYLVNDFCALEQIPMIYGAMHKYTGYVSLFANADDNSPHLRDIFPEPDPSLPKCSEVGVLSTIAGLIGLLQANEAMKYILQLGESLAGRLLTYDCLSHQQCIITIKKVWEDDLEEVYESQSYLSLDCAMAPEITVEALLQHRQQYTLVSVMQQVEHQALDKDSLWSDREHFDLETIVNSDRPIVIYCRSGRLSADFVNKLQGLYPHKEIYSLAGGFLAFQKFKALH